mmetsp:Transcript_34172/g.45179  ORF Transcript_34172/g.45179 Transcript_34172/m.45179 type:complete len:398 (-) Transcript_34172:225-1418(-)
MALLCKCALLLLLPVSSLAFVSNLKTPESLANKAPISFGKHVATRPRSSHLKMAEETEVEKLKRQAAEAKAAAAKLEEELESYKAANPKLVKEPEPEEPTPQKLTFDQVMEKLAPTPVLGQEAAEQMSALQSLKEEGVAQQWKSATLDYYKCTIARMESQTGIEGKDLSPLEGGSEDDLRFSLVVVCIGSFLLAAGSGIVIGGNLGATFTYLFAIVPIIFLGIGSTSPGIITATIEAIKTRTDSDYEERRIRHEAAHFLAGYLLGFPIKNYKSEGDLAEVEFYDTPNGDDLFNQQTEYNQKALEPLAIVAMSGVVGECLKFKNARGGQNDLMVLQQLLSRAKPYVRAEEQMNMTRWGVVEAYKLLSKREEQFEALVEAFKNKKSIQECIAIVESTDK